MQYFQKVKGSALNMAKQGAQMLANAQTNASEMMNEAGRGSAHGSGLGSTGNNMNGGISSSGSSDNSSKRDAGNVMTATVTNSSTLSQLNSKYQGLSAAEANLLREKDLIDAFQTVCEVIDSIGMENLSEEDQEQKLGQSRILRVRLNLIIALLQNDGERWMYENANISDPDSLKLTCCIDQFLQRRMANALCDRAITDRPRGVMALVIAFFTKLFRCVKYPLLPIVHKPVAQLLSVAVRFEAIHGNSFRTSAPSSYISSLNMNMSTSKSSVAKSVGVKGHALSSASSLLTPEQQVLRQKYARDANYKAVIDLRLTMLLDVLWRKIAENPTLLDFFIFSDTRRGSISSSVLESSPSAHIAPTPASSSLPGSRPGSVASPVRPMRLNMENPDSADDSPVPPAVVRSPAFEEAIGADSSLLQIKDITLRAGEPRGHGGNNTAQEGAGAAGVQCNARSWVAGPEGGTGNGAINSREVGGGGVLLVTGSMQMDVLAAVVRLLNQPAVARYAQEVLLIALNMRDERVTSFLRHRTALVHVLVSAVSTQFEIALATAREAYRAGSVRSLSQLYALTLTSSAVAPITTTVNAASGLLSPSQSTNSLRGFSLFSSGVASGGGASASTAAGSTTPASTNSSSTGKGGLISSISSSLSANFSNYAGNNAPIGGGWGLSSHGIGSSHGGSSAFSPGPAAGSSSAPTIQARTPLGRPPIASPPASATAAASTYSPKGGPAVGMSQKFSSILESRNISASIQESIKREQGRGQIEDLVNAAQFCSAVLVALAQPAQMYLSRVVPLGDSAINRATTMGAKGNRSSGEFMGAGEGAGAAESVLVGEDSAAMTGAITQFYKSLFLRDSLLPAISADGETTGLASSALLVRLLSALKLSRDANADVYEMGCNDFMGDRSWASSGIGTETVKSLLEITAQFLCSAYALPTLNPASATGVNSGGTGSLHRISSSVSVSSVGTSKSTESQGALSNAGSILSTGKGVSAAAAPTGVSDSSAAPAPELVPLLPVLFARTGSISKPLAASTCILTAVFLASSPFDMACRTLFLSHTAARGTVEGGAGTASGLIPGGNSFLIADKPSAGSATGTSTQSSSSKPAVDVNKFLAAYCKRMEAVPDSVAKSTSAAAGSTGSGVGKSSVYESFGASIAIDAGVQFTMQNRHSSDNLARSFSRGFVAENGDESSIQRGAEYKSESGARTGTEAGCGMRAVGVLEGSTDRLLFEHKVNVACASVLSRVSGNLHTVAHILTISNKKFSTNAVETDIEASFLGDREYVSVRQSIQDSIVLQILHRKVKAFLSLKYDEQVALSALLKQCLTLLAALLVSDSLAAASGSSGSRLETAAGVDILRTQTSRTGLLHQQTDGGQSGEKKRGEGEGGDAETETLRYITEIIGALESTWTELLCVAKARVPDFVRKAAALRHLMFRNCANVLLHGHHWQGQAAQQRGRGESEKTGTRDRSTPVRSTGGVLMIDDASEAHSGEGGSEGNSPIAANRSVGGGSNSPLPIGSAAAVAAQPRIKRASVSSQGRSVRARGLVVTDTPAVLLYTRTQNSSSPSRRGFFAGGDIGKPIGIAEVFDPALDGEMRKVLSSNGSDFPSSRAGSGLTSPFAGATMSAGGASRAGSAHAYNTPPPGAGIRSPLVGASELNSSSGTPTPLGGGGGGGGADMSTLIGISRQTQQILESLVLLFELRREVSSYLFAVRRLRGQQSMRSSTFSSTSSASAVGLHKGVGAGAGAEAGALDMYGEVENERLEEYADVLELEQLVEYAFLGSADIADSTTMPHVLDSLATDSVARIGQEEGEGDIGGDKRRREADSAGSGKVSEREGIKAKGSSEIPATIAQQLNREHALCRHTHLNALTRRLNQQQQQRYDNKAVEDQKYVGQISRFSNTHTAQQRPFWKGVRQQEEAFLREFAALEASLNDLVGS